LPIPVVEIRQINKNIQQISAYVILLLLKHFLIVVGDVQFGHQVKQVHFLYFAVVRQVVEQPANVSTTGNHALHYSTKCFKNSGVVDGSEEKLNLFHFHFVLTQSFL